MSNSVIKTYSNDSGSVEMKLLDSGKGYGVVLHTSFGPTRMFFDELFEDANTSFTGAVKQLTPDWRYGKDYQPRDRFI